MSPVGTELLRDSSCRLLLLLSRRFNLLYFPVDLGDQAVRSPSEDLLSAEGGAGPPFAEDGASVFAPDGACEVFHLFLQGLLGESRPEDVRALFLDD